jgi:hypothetical protein
MPDLDVCPFFLALHAGLWANPNLKGATDAELGTIRSSNKMPVQQQQPAKR